MRILVVGNCIPWPPSSGTRMRLANMVAGLAQLGDVDLFAVFSPNSRDSEVSAANPPVARMGAVHAPQPDFSGASRIAWLTRGRLPAYFVGRDYGAVRARFREWAAPPYDLVWYGRVQSYVALGSDIQGRAIVDIDDLEDQNILSRLRAMANNGDGLSSRELLHRLGARVQGKRNAHLWRRLEQEVAGSVEAAVVCSELDRLRLGVPNAFVVANGYELSAVPLGRHFVGAPPTILFQGLLVYPPNIDAVRFLVKRIAPLVWAQLPDVRFRLVGKPSEDVGRLSAPPRVEVTGHVPDMRTELARADLVALPIRYGGGTRIKVLEAFAHRIPVASTSFGVEGIDAIDGCHVLVRDDPEDFAAACVELLTDQQRRATIVEQAHKLFLDRYQWKGIRDQVAVLGAAVARGDPSVANGT